MLQSLPRHAGKASVAAVALMLTLSACAGDNTDTGSSSAPAAGGGSSAAATSDSAGGSAIATDAPASSAPFDKEKATGLLLTAQDAGAGYTALPASQLEKALQGQAMSQAQMDAVKVQPATCEAAYKAQAALSGRIAESIKSAAVTVLTAKGATAGSGNVVSESLAPASGSSTTIDESLLKNCAKMTITASGATVALQLSLVDVPKLGDKTVALRIAGDSSAGGVSVKLDTLVVSVDQNDKNMTVSVVSIGGANATAGAPDVEKLATTLSAKAYAKAESFLSE